MAMAAATSVIITSNLPRRSANYHPSIWGDRFIQYASEYMEVQDNYKEEQIKELKEEVKKMLVSSNKKPIKKIQLIDLIQRLGVNYHFESEIEKVLQQIHSSYIENGIAEFEQEDLHSLALLFRLLRQQGYHIAPDVFEKFKDGGEKGDIDERFSSDVDGLLSLYEATHLRVHGENFLEKAFAFTSTQLELMIPHLSPSLASKVKHTLRHPLHKSLPWLEACHFISSFKQDPSHDQTLLAFAKLNFNMLQSLHQKEIGHISKWWKKLDFARKLPFARDRVVECYFWILGVYFEPCYTLARMITTKVICITSVIDDVYDVYGTLEELQLLTTAIDRWDISCMEFLPEYMRYCYQALLDVYDEIEKDMIKEDRAFCVQYAKDEMKRLVGAYFVEAKWLNSNYTPTMEEYMGIAEITSAYRMLAATSFIGMGSVATKEAFQWLTSDPKIIRASTIVCRLMDDIVSNELEQKRGHVASAIECYMKQHGVTKEDAIEVLKKEVISAWKDINEEWLHTKQVAKPLLIRILNFSRVIYVLYTDEDGYTNSQGSTKDHIKALLLTPFPL